MRAHPEQIPVDRSEELLLEPDLYYFHPSSTRRKYVADGVRLAASDAAGLQRRDPVLAGLVRELLSRAAEIGRSG